MNTSYAQITESEMLRRLPVPEIQEETFQHSFKQANRKDDISRLKPPKLKPPRYDNNFNRSHSAHVISFRGENESSLVADSSLLGDRYDRSSKETYFEQCFICLAKIGEGSFGEVFKVRSKEDGHLYAVKMSKQLFRSELYRQERLEEVRRYEQFSGHDNCVRFYRAWEQDDRLFMQMELCRESLESYLERKRHIPEKKIWSILLDLLLALKSLHDRNLLHLDIKLDNVLIGDNNSCKLADFGLVIDVDRANRHQATEGDSRYVAPEIMQGKFSKSADIFSLGIAMLELACNLELPANGPLWQQLRSASLPEDFIKYLSEDLLYIIKQMMTPDPLQRPSVDELLNHKKLSAMLKRRNHWQLVGKVKQIILKSQRFAWSKLCLAKDVLFQAITCLLVVFGMRHSPNIEYSTQLHKEADKLEEKSTKPTHLTTPISNTPCLSKAKARIDFHFNSESSDIIHDSSPYETSANKARLVNSTPLIPHHQSVSFRSRRDLSKTSFNEDASADSYWDRSTCDYLEDDFDGDSNSSSFRKTFDVSLLKGKKLFT